MAILLFVGAPPPSSITVESCTLTHFTQPFTALLDLDSNSHDDVASSAPNIAWRSLPSTRQPLHTGLTQPQHEDFITALLDADEQDLTRFCEESLATGSWNDSSSSLTNDSTTDSIYQDSTIIDPSNNSNVRPPPCPAHISHLATIPPASRIPSLPRPATLNLIVAVLSVAPPRAVTTRWGTVFSLVEVLVGDDTRCPFAITFWIPSGKGPRDTAAADAVFGIRRQDVILVRNVALHVFRGRVYGQSLRGGVTKVVLLWRRHDGDDSHAYYANHHLTRGAAEPQQEKTRLVRDWVVRFVGRGHASSWDKPPDDTQ